MFANAHGLISRGFWLRMRAFLLCAVLPLGASFAEESPQRYSPEDIVVTRWVDPTGSNPLTAAEWLREHPPSPMNASIVWSATGRQGGLLFLASEHVWDSLSETLLEYVGQVSAEGWGITAMAVHGGTPASLKGIIASQSPQPVGVFMVGTLPVAWFQILSDWGYEEFPIDLYFMDLDGIWADVYSHQVIAGRDTLLPGSDGIYDTHTGPVCPEVPVGRLEASTIDWSHEETLIENYFVKNLAYRRGGLRLAQRGLSYVDDDWSNWTTVGLDMVYPQVIVMNDPELTRANDYSERLRDGFEWIGIMAHSWPGGHSFKYNDGQSWDSFYAWDLLYSVDAKANFYNLFACSNARYTDANYMAGIYVMAGTWGLGALGSTKTGSMLYFEDFYGPLGHGDTIGDAYLQWFHDMAIGGFELWEKLWFYGMTLIGDPTLRPALPADEQAPIPLSDLAISASGDSVYLTWSPATDDLWVEHYVIYRFDRAFHEVKHIDSLAVVVSPGFADAMPAGGSPGACYLVRARDGAGNLAGDSNRVALFPFQIAVLPSQSLGPFRTTYRALEDQ